MVLTVAALVLGVVWIVAPSHETDGRPRGAGRSNSWRLVTPRSEVERDEYFQRRNDLEGA